MTDWWMILQVMSEVGSRQIILKLIGLPSTHHRSQSGRERWRFFYLIDELPSSLNESHLLTKRRSTADEWILQSNRRV